MSHGGPIDAGVKLATWVQENGVGIEVDRLCMSSCANYVFAAGKTKVIRSNSLVIWHGSALQKDFREMLARYKDLHAQKLQGAELKADDDEFLANNEKGFPKWEMQTKLQRDFFSSTGIDEYITRMGQEPVNFRAAWTISVADMAKFGLKNVTASDDYGSVEYVERVLPDTGLLAKPISLKIEADGTVVKL